MDDDGWTVIHVRRETKKALDRAKKRKDMSYDNYIGEVLKYNRSRKIERTLTKRLKLFPDL